MVIRELKNVLIINTTKKTKRARIKEKKAKKGRKEVKKGCLQ